MLTITKTTTEKITALQGCGKGTDNSCGITVKHG